MGEAAAASAAAGSVGGSEGGSVHGGDHSRMSADEMRAQHEREEESGWLGAEYIGMKRRGSMRSSPMKPTVRAFGVGDAVGVFLPGSASWAEEAAKLAKASGADDEAVEAAREAVTKARFLPCRVVGVPSFNSYQVRAQFAVVKKPIGGTMMVPLDDALAPFDADTEGLPVKALSVVARAWRETHAPTLV